MDVDADLAVVVGIVAGFVVRFALVVANQVTTVAVVARLVGSVDLLLHPC
jgi:hypothetical protein